MMKLPPPPQRCHATSQEVDEPSSPRFRMNEKQRDVVPSALPDVWRSTGRTPRQSADLVVAALVSTATAFG